MSLPTDDKTRKGLLLFQGLLKYFPHALAAVAENSRIANEQHNPGEPVHWAKEKSREELDSLLRHVTDMAVDPNHRDPDGIRAAVKAAWRALANLERQFDAGENIFAMNPAEMFAGPAEGESDFTVGRHMSLLDIQGSLTGRISSPIGGVSEGAPASIDDVPLEDWDKLANPRVEE